MVGSKIAQRRLETSTPLSGKGALHLRLALLFAFVTAFLGQTLATQLHVDRIAAAYSASENSPAVWKNTTHSAAHDSEECPICQQARTGSNYLFSSVALVVLVAALTAFYTTLSITVGTAPTRSHIWQSRAPPVSLSV